MQPPIFRPSFGNKPDSVVGRDDVLSATAACFDSYPGTRERAMLIIGQRGMGKTALLLEAADIAVRHDFVPVRTTCGTAMLDNIIDGIQRTGEAILNDKKKPVKGFSAGALGFSFGLTFTDEVQKTYGFRTKLEMICDRLNEMGKGIAVLVDEVRADSDPMRQLTTAYQELAGDGKNIAIIMAGLPAVVSEVLDEATLTFLNRATKIELGPITISSVRAYYASAFKRARRTVEGDVLDAAASSTEGFPYLLQLIGYYLMELTSDGELITRDVLDEALRLAEGDMNENVFRAMLRPLSRGDVDFLQAMAQDEGTTRVGDLEGRLGVSQGHVQSYRKRLIEAGVVIAPRRGELEFIVPGLARYLRDNER